MHCGVVSFNEVCREKNKEYLMISGVNLLFYTLHFWFSDFMVFDFRESDGYLNWVRFRRFKNMIGSAS